MKDHTCRWSNCVNIGVSNCVCCIQINYSICTLTFNCIFTIHTDICCIIPFWVNFVYSIVCPCRKIFNFKRLAVFQCKCSFLSICHCNICFVCRISSVNSIHNNSKSELIIFICSTSGNSFCNF